MSQAVDRAVALGADVVGLGALTATVTAGGATLRARTDIAVTNGNAFTAAILEDQIRMLLPARSSAPLGRTSPSSARAEASAPRSRDCSLATPPAPA